MVRAAATETKDLGSLPDWAKPATTNDLTLVKLEVCFEVERLVGLFECLIHWNDRLLRVPLFLLGHL